MAFYAYATLYDFTDSTSACNHAELLHACLEAHWVNKLRRLLMAHQAGR